MKWKPLDLCHSERVPHLTLYDDCVCGWPEMWKGRWYDACNSVRIGDFG